MSIAGEDGEPSGGPSTVEMDGPDGKFTLQVVQVDGAWKVSWESDINFGP